MLYSGMAYDAKKIKLLCDMNKLHLTEYEVDSN